MKKILFITVIAVVFILASCTLAPFAYMFGGGMISGGGHSSSTKVDLKLLFTEEELLDVLAYYIVEIKGETNIYDDNISKDTQVLEYSLKPGEYSLRVRAMRSDGKMLGVFNKNILLDPSQEKEMEVVVDLNRTVSLTITFDSDDMPAAQLKESRLIDNRTGNIKLFIRSGTDGQGALIEAKEKPTNGASVSFTVDLETDNDYTFEAYTQVVGLAPGDSLQTQLAPSTQTLGYGATQVYIGAVQNYNVVIDVNNFSASATQQDEAFGNLVYPKVDIVFPAHYTEYRMPNLPVSTGPIPATDWGNVNLYYILATNTTTDATAVNLRTPDAQLVTYYPGSNSAAFKHTSGIDLASAGEYYYWFSATDTNNVWFHFPLSSVYTGGSVLNEPESFVLYADSSGEIIVQ